MRIQSNKPDLFDPPKAREKTATDAPARAAETQKADASLPSASSATPSASAPVPATDAAMPSANATLPSASLDRTVQTSDVAAREFEQTIAARLDQVKEQLASGDYAVDYDRLARRLADEGFTL